jgi:hypothetical protein
MLKKFNLDCNKTSNYSPPLVSNSLSSNHPSALAEISHEFDRRATNIGYGLGIFIGRLLGFRHNDEYTDISEEDYDFDSDSDNDEDYSSVIFAGLNDRVLSITEPFVLDFEPIEISLHEQKYFANKSLTKEDLASLSQPHALLLTALNSYPESNPFINIPARIATRVDKLMKEYVVHEKTIASIEDFCQSIEKAIEKGPVKLLIFSGHGTYNTLQLQGLPDDQMTDHHFDEWISLENHLNQLQDLSCLAKLKDTIIILDSCNTATEESFEIEETGFYINLNIHKLIAAFAPASTVFAPDFKLEAGSIIFNSTGVFGCDSDLHAKVIKERIAKKNYTLPELFPLRDPQFDGATIVSFKKISHDNSDFCYEVLPYFSMRTYCDKARKQPADDKIQACSNNLRCKRAIEILAAPFEEKFVPSSN